MGLNNPVMSEGFVPAYQISATPFVTASNVTTVAAVTFPFVTRFFTVQNRSALERLQGRQALPFELDRSLHAVRRAGWFDKRSGVKLQRCDRLRRFRGRGLTSL